MSPQQSVWIGAAANLLLPLALVGLCTAAWNSRALRERITDHVAHAEIELRYLQLSLKGARLVLFQSTGIGLLLLLAVATGEPWPLLPCVAAVIGPNLWLSQRRRERTTAVDAQLDAWLLALANALRASPSLGDSIETSASLVAAPLSEELRLAVKENRLGLPLDRALHEMAERIGSPVFSAAIATLRIARNTGGDLSSTLEGAAASLREMARLEGVVRTKTAEGRAQAWVIGVIPLPLVYMLHLLDPGLLEPLWSTDKGHLVLAAAVLLWMTALVLARKIVDVDV